MRQLIESMRRDGVMRKGEWHRERHPIFGQHNASVCCPACGKLSTLEDHAIDPDGTVTPSLVCPFKCDFHEFVKLADWKA